MASTTPGAAIPGALAQAVGATAEGRAWLAALPQLIATARRRWDLRLGEPFLSGTAAWTAPAVMCQEPQAGCEVVLKISFPHDEARYEADALRSWAGRGAARLIDADGWSLLLERCRPGVMLSADQGLDQDRLAAGALALAELHCACGPTAAPHGGVQRSGEAVTCAAPRPFPPMDTVCGQWADLLESRATRAAAGGLIVEPGLVRDAAHLLRTLPQTASRVVVHGDANPGNLLRHGEVWVWIDPKPMVGDPAYDPWPLLEQVGSPFAAPNPVAELTWRTQLAAATLGLDPGRVACWCLARSVEAALWEWDVRGKGASAAQFLSQATIWRKIAQNRP